MKNWIMVAICSLLLGNASAATGTPATSPIEAQADQLRDAAMEKSEQGDQAAALVLNRHALKVTRHLPETSWRTIENYDDAGLFHYQSRHWKRSAQQQAIAVLLSCANPEGQAMFQEYVKRLGWAFAKYRPQQDFAPIAENPLILLQDIRLNVRANYDLRRRFFTTIKVKPTPPGGRVRYIYKLKQDAVPQLPCTLE